MESDYIENLQIVRQHIKDRQLPLQFMVAATKRHATLNMQDVDAILAAVGVKESLSLPSADFDPSNASLSGIPPELLRSGQW